MKTPSHCQWPGDSEDDWYDEDGEDDPYDLPGSFQEPLPGIGYIFDPCELDRSLTDSARTSVPRTPIGTKTKDSNTVSIF